MAIDQSAVIAKMRELVATVTGINAAYSAADNNDDRLPFALNNTPAALVLPGATLAYTLMDGQHRHTYEVRVQVLEAGGDGGIRDATLAVMPDRVLAVFAANVGLGGVCNSCVFRRSGGLQGFEYGGVDYTGYELTYEVSEQGSISTAYGS